MPNYVYQRLKVSNYEDKESLIRCREKILKDGTLNFNNLLPQPENIFKGPLGEDERRMCVAAGRPNWYDWNTENWGTKWNAGDFKMVEENDYSFCIDFHTAWNSPEPIINLIMEICHEQDFQYLAIDEGGFFAFSIDKPSFGEVVRKDMKDYFSEIMLALKGY